LVIPIYIDDLQINKKQSQGHMARLKEYLLEREYALDNSWYIARGRGCRLLKTFRRLDLCQIWLL